MLRYLTFALKIELNQVAFNVDMFWTKSRDAVAAILAGVKLAAGSNETSRQDAQDAGHYSLAPEPWLPQFARHDLAHVRQRLGKLQQSQKFLPIAPGSVVLVIKILPTTSGVLTNSLQRRA